MAHTSRTGLYQCDQWDSNLLRTGRSNLYPRVVSAGQGYVDTGHGHIGRNETGLPAKDVTISIVPVGETVLRQNIQGKYCFFNE